MDRPRQRRVRLLWVRGVVSETELNLTSEHGPALYYVTSDRRTILSIDIGTVKDAYPDAMSDTGHREQLICRALIKHALAMMNGEDAA